MARVALIIVGTLAALALWAALVFFGAREGWLRSMPAARGDTAGFMQWAESRYAASSRGNIAIVLLDDGDVSQSYFASHGRPVDGDSLFQVASLSKWLTAWGVMRLVEQGRVELDAPVSRYLTRWRLPPGDYNNDQVTVRRLLSHTSGLTDGLGFMGFAPDASPLSIEDELTAPADVMPGAAGAVRVGARANGVWRYSGGGYLILQLLIEEVTQQPFNTYMQSAVFAPLGMDDSTFVDPDFDRLADFFAEDGAPATHYRFTATGAASLYTPANDLTRFLQAQDDGGGVLRTATLDEMRAPAGYLFGLPVWGLGPTLYAPTPSGAVVIGHDGQNFPAINVTARVDPATGDGIIVLQTGSASLAREIGGEWTYWQTGNVPLDTLVLFDLQRILIAFAAGALVIVIGAYFLARTRSPSPLRRGA